MGEHVKWKSCIQDLLADMCYRQPLGRKKNDPNRSLSLLSVPAQGPDVPQPLVQQKCRRVPKVLCRVQARLLIQLAFIKAYFTNTDLLIQARPRDICTQDSHVSYRNRGTQKTPLHCLTYSRSNEEHSQDQSQDTALPELRCDYRDMPSFSTPGLPSSHKVCLHLSLPLVLPSFSNLGRKHNENLKVENPQP